MPANIYYDKDADLGILKNKMIAILGYGSQGHAQAQNLRDSGLNVVVGLKKDSKSWVQAERDGLKVTTVSEACAQAQVIQILAPDSVQKKLFENEVNPNLEEGNALLFSHGFNIHFGQIVPPKHVDVILIAPKSPGHIMRRVYVEGGGVPSLIAIQQDYTGKAKQVGLAYAKGIGSTRAGVLETTFREETETDLFGEQTVLCGGVTELVRAGFDTLVEAGYQPEIAYFECMHELKLIVDLFYQGGINYMRYSVSDTAKYGDLTRGRRVINEATRKEMKKILDEIQTGQFAKEWILENEAGRPVYNATLKRDSTHLIERVGASLRRMMTWIGAKEIEF